MIFRGSLIWRTVGAGIAVHGFAVDRQPCVAVGTTVRGGRALTERASLKCAAYLV